MKDPTRTDVLLALWSLLNLDDEDHLHGLVEPAALTGLYDDLQADLARATAAADELDDLPVALGWN